MGEREQWRAERAQVERALAAVGTALYRLNEAADALRDARRWSAYDTWQGGGWFASLRKRERADRAQQVLRAADHALGPLREELARLDLVHLEEAPRGRGPLGRAASTAGDWLVARWFDDLLRDLVVHRRLRDAAQRVEVGAAAAVRLQSALGRRRDALDERLGGGVAERE